MNIEYINGDILKKAFLGAANTLEKNKETVNLLNVFPVPDGDTGTNMSLTMQSAAKVLNKVNGENIDDIATAVANGSLMGARGNSGVILSQLLRGLAKGIKGKEKLNTNDIAYAFTLAKETAYKAVMKPIEGTILTVARECANKANEIAKSQKDIILFLEEVISYGEVTLEKTPDMLEVLKQAGVVDAGGMGLILLLKGALNSLKGYEDSYIEETIEYKETKFEHDHIISEEIEFGYCTEFIINKTKADPPKFREFISNYGDSILVVGADDVVKVHIHTNNPGTVLEEALKLGELIDIKIDNMRYQHSNKVLKEEVQKPKKKYSFIAISMGDGVEKIFKDLNVDYVIAGGQTMNPSTEDILNAVDKVTGDNIIILPNNSNIILAASQAKKLSDRNIEVIGTKTIPQGISAMLSFDEELNLEENLENMTEAMKDIKTGQVTYAVRDTVINDIEIKKDNIIGICNGDIKSVGESIEGVSVDLLKKAAGDGTDLITIFYGEDVSVEEANSLSDKIQEEIEDCDVEVVYGGQPLYYYLFSIE